MDYFRLHTITFWIASPKNNHTTVKNFKTWAWFERTTLRDEWSPGCHSKNDKVAKTSKRYYLLAIVSISMVACDQFNVKTEMSRASAKMRKGDEKVTFLQILVASVTTAVIILLFVLLLVLIVLWKRRSDKRGRKQAFLKSKISSLCITNLIINVCLLFFMLFNLGFMALIDIIKSKFQKKN